MEVFTPTPSIRHIFSEWRKDFDISPVARSNYENYIYDILQYGEGGNDLDSNAVFQLIEYSEILIKEGEVGTIVDEARALVKRLKTWFEKHDKGEGVRFNDKKAG
ncbi:MAG: hypothetical protein ABFS45_09670 [Pseudomonadota bacterium]